MESEVEEVSSSVVKILTATFQESLLQALAEVCGKVIFCPSEEASLFKENWNDGVESKFLVCAHLSP